MKENANDKAKQHHVSTNNQVKHINVNHTAKDVKNQVNTHLEPIANASNAIDSKQTNNTTLNSSALTVQGQEETANTSIVQASLSNRAKEVVNGTLNE